MVNERSGPGSLDGRHGQKRLSVNAALRQGAGQNRDMRFHMHCEERENS